MKSSASESIKNGYFNLERLRRSFRLDEVEISTLQRLCFRRRTFHVPILMHKLLYGIYLSSSRTGTGTRTVLGTHVEWQIKFDV